MRPMIPFRFLAAFLAVCTLFITVSCSSPANSAETFSSSGQHDEQNENTTGGRLIVEDPDYQLTGEEREAMAARLSGFAANWIRVTEGLALDEDQLNEARRFCAEKVLPILEADFVTRAECERICDALDAFAQSRRENRVLSRDDLIALWQNGTSLLGKERFGNVFYGCVLLAIDTQIEKNDARFETYGYEWYRTDAETFRNTRRDLTEEVGSAAFSGVCETLWALASLSESLPGGGDSPLNDAEIVKLLQTIFRDLSAKSITARQWEITVRTAALLLPDSVRIPESLNDQQKKEVRALLRNDYPENVARTLPALVDLLNAAGSALTAGTLAQLRDGTESERVAALCGLLSGVPDALRAYLDALETCGATGTEEEQKTVSKRTDDYEAFFAAHPAVDADAVQSAIHSRARNESTGNDPDAALREVLIGYGVRIAPYLTFALTDTSGSTSSQERDSEK